MLQTYKNNFEIADLEIGEYFLLKNPETGFKFLLVL